MLFLEISILSSHLVVFFPWQSVGNLSIGFELGKSTESQPQHLLTTWMVELGLTDSLQEWKKHRWRDWPAGGTCFQMRSLRTDVLPLGIPCFWQPWRTDPLCQSIEGSCWWSDRCSSSWLRKLQQYPTGPSQVSSTHSLLEWADRL